MGLCSPGGLENTASGVSGGIGSGVGGASCSVSSPSNNCNRYMNNTVRPQTIPILEWIEKKDVGD